MRSKIYNLKKSFMKVRRSSSKDVEEAMAGGLNKVILQHICTKEQDDVAVKNRQQNVSL